MSSRAELLLMYEIGYLQGKVDAYEEARKFPQTKPIEVNKHETISTTQPKLLCSLDEQTKEVAEDAIRKKYRTKQ